MKDNLWGIALAVPLGPASTSAPPCLRLAGLPLGLRLVLTLQQVGATRIRVVLGHGDADLGDRIVADRRVRCPLEVVILRRGELPMAAALGRIEGEWLLGRHDLVVPPRLYAQLRDAPLDEDGARMAHMGNTPLGVMRGFAPMAAALGGLRAPLGWHALAELDGIGRAQVGGWVADASTASGRQRATRLLFEDCRKPVDGLVARHLNRRVSIAVSRLLVDTPASPNALTAFTFAVAVAAAAVACRGGYVENLVAAALMQLNSILDGCDGELARVRFQGSELGKWLDTIGDDASNVLFWAALAVGSSALEPHGRWLMLSGWIAAGANAAAALVNYALMARLGSGDLYDLEAGDSRPKGRVVSVIALLLKQDTFLLLILLLAALGVLPYALPAIALGAVVTLVNSLLRAAHISVRRAGSRPEPPTAR